MPMIIRKPVMRALLVGSNRCDAAGFTVRGWAPVTKLCRVLIEGGYDPGKGIKFSDTHIWLMVRAGDFPKPVKIGNRNHWLKNEIDEYIAAKLAQRGNVGA